MNKHQLTDNEEEEMETMSTGTNKQKESFFLKLSNSRDKKKPITSLSMSKFGNRQY